jgi:NADPH-dependent 2,4-dienoyl-CoA reductase/sulfur reductase-like enzyme
MTRTDVAIIGAGPYGLAAAAHLRRAGVETRILGEPMAFWHTMPAGMLLRSNRPATSIAEWRGPLSLENYGVEIGERITLPIPLTRFLDYGAWVQRQVAPDVDQRPIVRLDRHSGGFALDGADGNRLYARRVVVAGGIAPFAHRPAQCAGLPREFVSHTGEHRDLDVLADRRVLVVGGGQSALESAAMLHEKGADVEVIVRAPRVNWLHGGKYHRRLGRAAPLVYAPTDVGPMGLSRLVAVPDLFRRLPRPVQEPLAYRAIRPAGAAWLVPRLREVPVHLGTGLRSVSLRRDKLAVELTDGRQSVVDHLLLGTGYRVDVAKYPFLAPELTAAVRRVCGYPVLRRGMESSVPGLHFVGAPAAWSFGPTMRFVSGSWYASRSVARAARGVGDGAFVDEAETSTRTVA